MPTVTRSREQSSNKHSTFYVLIDKTSRNSVNKVRTTEKASDKPEKKKPTTAPRAATKSRKVNVKPPSRSLTPQVEGEDAPQPAGVGELDDPFRLILSPGRAGGFATPPQSHPPPRPPKRPEHHSHDPMTTLPPQFHDDGTPSPEPGRRRSRHVGGGVSPLLLLPPSSPIHLSSSPVRQTHNDGGSIFPSTIRPWSPSQFRTPTRKNRKRKRTPISQPHLQSEGELNNDDLFAYGVVDDLDEREESVPWENTGSDKENHGGPQEALGSDDVPSMPVASERGILQPRDASLSPVRTGDSDPFGFFATERLLKARRAEKKKVANTEAGPSNPHRAPRLPLGELAAAEVVPPTITSESIPFPTSPSQSQSQSRPASPYRRYSDSEIEDLYAPASPPHTPRSRLPHAQATSPHGEATPVADANPLTPRNGDSARVFTMRRRRHKELHGVSEHGSELEGSSAPSSPSPVKRVHQRLPEHESQIDYEDNRGSDEEERRRLPKKAKLRGKGGGKENAGRKGPTAVDPMEAARRVLENAPRRMPPRRATTAKKNKASSNLVDVEGVDGRREERRQPTRGRGATRSASGRASRGKGGSRTSRSRKKKGDESTPEDVSEKREEERLKRVEYFRQLDGYKLRKENVYVI